MNENNKDLEDNAAIVHEVLEKVDRKDITTIINAISFVIKWGLFMLSFGIAIASTVVIMLYGWIWIIKNYPL